MDILSSLFCEYSITYEIVAADMREKIPYKNNY